MKVPRHIGFIMDGNRRFAKKLMMKPWMGHEWGAKKLEKVLEWCKELGVKEITFYAFSLQNFNRPKEEFDYLMDLFRENFRKLNNDNKRLQKSRIRINFIGRIWKFPKDIQQSMKELMEKTKDFKNYIVNFAMAYGGREEVIDAVKKIGEKIKKGKVKIDDINEKVFSQGLYTDHEPDLIIRTGGEKRTSNFLIWQSWYSEWSFLDVAWPELEKKHIAKAIEDYAQRERRFGK